MHARTYAHTHACYIVCESKRLLCGPLCLLPGSICSLNMSHGLPQHLDQDEAVRIMRIPSPALSHSSFPFWSALLLFFRTRGRRTYRIGYPTCFLGSLLNTLLLLLTLATHSGRTHTSCWASWSPHFPLLGFLPSLECCSAWSFQMPPSLPEIPPLMAPLPSCELGPITWIM